MRCSLSVFGLRGMTPRSRQRLQTSACIRVGAPQYMQVEARELLRSAVQQLPGNQTELPEDLERDYIDVIQDLERRMLEDEVQHEES